MCRRFGVKCFNTNDKEHLIKALQDKYDITIDDSGKNFCGLTLDWNYVHGYVDVLNGPYQYMVQIDNLRNQPTIHLYSLRHNRKESKALWVHFSITGEQ